MKRTDPGPLTETERLLFFNALCIARDQYRRDADALSKLAGHERAAAQLRQQAVSCDRWAYDIENAESVEVKFK